MSDNKSIVDKIFEELKIELNWEEPIIDFHCQESDLVYIGNDAMTRDIYEMMYPLRDYSTGVKKDFAILCALRYAQNPEDLDEYLRIFLDEEEEKEEYVEVCKIKLKKGFQDY